jgi:hypothetical protein
MMMTASITERIQDSASDAGTWLWPIRIANYERTSSLTATERDLLKCEVSGNLQTERGARGMLCESAGLQRLLTPINDALAVIDTGRTCGDRVRLILLQGCSEQRTSFWAWEETVWYKVIGTSQKNFYTVHDLKRRGSGERQALVAVAYLLHGIRDISSIGEVKRVALAEKIFGKERVAAALRRVADILTLWGYCGQSQPLMSMVAELLLMNQRPELEALTADLIGAVRARWRDSSQRSSLCFQMSRALAALRIIPDEPKVHDTVDRERIAAARIAGIAADWVTMVERWEATSTLTAASRRLFRNMILKTGRWLKARHPEITGADQWTRELAAEYVGAVDRMRVGDYVWHTGGISSKLGKPISARSKNSLLGSMRCFFADAQEWEWIPRRFDPSRAFATPRPIKSLIGPVPRTIADDLWAKLLWAGLNLTSSDLSLHGSVASYGSSPDYVATKSFDYELAACGKDHQQTYPRNNAGCSMFQFRRQGPRLPSPSTLLLAKRYQPGSACVQYNRLRSTSRQASRLISCFRIVRE